MHVLNSQGLESSGIQNTSLRDPLAPAITSRTALRRKSTDRGRFMCLLVLILG